MNGIRPDMNLQRSFWNEWNASTREVELADRSLLQLSAIERWLRQLGRKDLRLIDVGCGAGWLCERLRPYGKVTGTDIADEVLDRARIRAPDVTFVPGDIMQLEFADAPFDVTLSLEVLSHVADQRAFIEKLAQLTRPGGLLMLATQNRPICELNRDIPPPKPGQLRKWVNSRELRQLVEPWFSVKELRSIEPVGRGGVLRIVNAYKINELMNVLTFGNYTRIKEFLGLGFTLMLLAERRS